PPATGRPGGTRPGGVGPRLDGAPRADPEAPPGRGPVRGALGALGAYPRRPARAGAPADDRRGNPVGLLPRRRLGAGPARVLGARPRPGARPPAPAAGPAGGPGRRYPDPPAPARDRARAHHRRR